MRFTHALAPLAALIAGLAIVPSARADFNHPDPIRNQKNENFCIGIGGGSTANGANAGLFTCDGRANQSYKLDGSRELVQFKVQNGTGQCLRVDELSDGGLSRVVEQGSCFDDRSYFRLTNVQPFGNYFRLATIQSRKHPNLCIGAGGGAMFNGNVVKAYGCGFAAFGNQNWVVNPHQSFVP